MDVKYTKEAQKDIKIWKKKKNKTVEKRISNLIFSIEKTPYKGIGNPEELKHQLSGLWSRQINKEHRLVYEYIKDENLIVIHSLYGHYK